ncbi:MAG: sodium-dependent transporter [Rhodocyclaceae bacterium]|nr:sodium-dependent transporter [Rhodocyclaceae bacterium]
MVQGAAGAIAGKVHGHWSSRMGFIIAAVGSAVGLGNVWKFPYMVGQSGGAAFVLVYLACIALIGLPIIVAEWLIGRRGQKNPVNTMADLARSQNRSPAWVAVGIAGTLAGFLILSFYSVIGGWSLAYLGDAASGTFAGIDKATAGALFDGLLASPGTLLAWHTLFMAVVIGIVCRGVRGGLERASRLLMPALGAILVVLVAYGMTTDGFGAAVSYLFSPDWNRLTGEVVLAALGHAFFTLSLGMGVMMAYGSYLGQEVNLLRAARTVAIADTVIALFAGLAIFPIVFSHGLDAAAGPGLVFVTLPLAFGGLSGGSLLASLFFALLVFAAVTSAISLLEPAVELVEERTPLSRVGAGLATGLAAWALGIVALLSFNAWSDVLIFGNTVFDTLDKLTSKFLLPLTGLGAIAFVAWCLDRESVRAELRLSPTAFRVWDVVARFVAPIGVLIVFINSL